MYITVHVIPNAKKVKIEEENGKLVVHVDAPPVGGKANKRLIEILAKHFKVRKSAVRIIRGEKSREKVIEIKEI
ncbi:MAG: DUF167 domain-containing protein [Candidatus Asgardarchaeia archaeon]